MNNHKKQRATSKITKEPKQKSRLGTASNVGLKTLLLQGLSEPEFYGDLVYKFRKIIGKTDFPYHFKKIIVRYKKIGYNINVMDRRHAWLLIQSRLTALLTSLIARR